MVKGFLFVIQQKEKGSSTLLFSMLKIQSCFNLVVYIDKYKAFQMIKKTKLCYYLFQLLDLARNSEFHRNGWNNPKQIFQVLLEVPALAFNTTFQELIKGRSCIELRGPCRIQLSIQGYQYCLGFFLEPQSVLSLQNFISLEIRMGLEKIY